MLPILRPHQIRTFHGQSAYQHLLGLEEITIGAGMSSSLCTTAPTYSTIMPFRYDNMNQRSSHNDGQGELVMLGSAPVV